MRKGSFDIRKIKDQVVARLLTRFPFIFKRWARRADIMQFDQSPWTELSKELNQCRIALITTGGVHLKSQPPFDMLDPAGDPSFREIPADTEADELTITHNYYDHSDADSDVNIVFPIERVKDLKDSGDIDSVNGRHFSLMGHITGAHLETLLNDTAPRIAAELKKDEVDIAILTPA
jgi:D-proline reductase (dithiol) PrdB